MKALIIITAISAFAPVASAQEWSFFDAPVKIDKTWYDELGEGNIMTGLTITDALDTYDIICVNDTEMGGVLPGIYVRYSDSAYQEITGLPSVILQDERGNSWTTLQWAEACQRMGMLR